MPYKTCFYHLIVYGDIVETDYFVSNQNLDEFSLSSKILERYIDDIRDNQITDFNIEVFHVVVYTENYNDVVNCLKYELDI